MGLAFANQLIQGSHPKHLCCGLSHRDTVPLPSSPRARYMTARASLSAQIPLKSFSLAKLDLLILPHLFLPPETTVKTLSTVPPLFLTGLGSLWGPVWCDSPLGNCEEQPIRLKVVVS